MEQQRRLYPVGLQDFKEIRVKKGLYIDKTEYVYRMTHSLGKYYFLSRPRRFGKTLLVSTLQYYFEGHRELFEGLAIDALEAEWTEYPVLRFDMSRAKKESREKVQHELTLQLMRYEKLYGRMDAEIDPCQRFEGVIQRAYEQTGKKVVVLIDEYDAPLLEVIHDKSVLEGIRNEMGEFYRTLKSNDVYLRFVFLTGITKFAQLSLFSGLNNIDDISMVKEYGAICGITKSELKEQMQTDIAILSKRLGLSEAETWDRLVENYDGYHFTYPSEDIFNPYSLFKAFNNGELDSYWFETATPKSLIKLLRRNDAHPTFAGSILARKSRFNVPIENATDYIALLYQTGYMTIKNYDPELELYTLDIPNREVRVGLMEELSSYYLPQGVNSDITVSLIRKALSHNDMGAALQAIQNFLHLIPYSYNTNNEGHYQEMLACLFILAGAEVALEDHTRNGRIDIVVRTRTRLYVLELKLNKSEAEAMKQINDKGYSRRFAGCGLPVVKVGINFDGGQRNISDWVIEV